MRRIIVPAATVVIVVVALVGLSGWNRSAAPSQVIELTERELPLPFGSVDRWRDGVPLALGLEIEHRYDALDARNWLSEDRLRALGFAINVPAGAPEAADTYRRVPPRLGWVVLEYDGAAFQEIERRRALQREKAMWRDQLEPTRLVPVDADPDFDALRARYDARHLIVRAVIGLTYLGPNDRGPLLYGTVQSVVPSQVSVPRRLREALTALPSRPVTGPDGPHTLAPPRYAAEIASGPLGILYLRSVKRIGS